MGFSQDVNLPRNLLSLLLVVVVKSAGWFTCGHTVGGRWNGRGRYGQRRLLCRPFLTLSADKRNPAFPSSTQSLLSLAASRGATLPYEYGVSLIIYRLIHNLSTFSLPTRQPYPYHCPDSLCVSHALPTYPPAVPLPLPRQSVCHFLHPLTQPGPTASLTSPTPCRQAQPTRQWTPLAPFTGQ